MYSKPANEFTTDDLADMLGRTTYKSPIQVDPFIKAGPFEEYCKEHGANINKSAVFYVHDHPNSGIGFSLLGDVPGDSQASRIIALGLVKCFREKGNGRTLLNQDLESQPKGENGLSTRARRMDWRASSKRWALSKTTLLPRARYNWFTLGSNRALYRRYIATV